MHSIEEVLDYAKVHSEEQIFICGGDTIYEQFMPYVSKLYLTVIEEETPVEAEAFFPEVDTDVWKKTEENPSKEWNGITPNYIFTVWEKR